MILYLGRDQVPDRENLSPEVLRWCIRRGEQAAGRYQRLRRYYRGEHDIFRTRGDSEFVPVAVNYARYVVDIVLGYYLGEPVKYDANPVRQLGSTPVELTPLLTCYDRQQMGGTDLEIGRTMGIMGDCLELCYPTDEENPTPHSAVIDPSCGILVCDNSVEHRKLFGVIWERSENPQGEVTYEVTCCTDQSVRRYRCGELEETDFYAVSEPVPHYFGGVPLIAYENNSERQGDFEQIMSLMDAYDSLMSSRLTDKKKFVDALLVFFGMTLAPEEENRLSRERFIDGAPLDARAEYIQKTFDEAGVQVLADALVREMHKMTMTVDMSDEQFSGNSSGQALKLKLLTMNLLVRGKMRQLERGLKERMTLYSHWLSVKGDMDPVCAEDIDVVFTVNLPINESEVVDMVTKLRGMVDDQTLLGQLWFVKDPAEALENRRRQEETAGKACFNKDETPRAERNGAGREEEEHE